MENLWKWYIVLFAVLLYLVIAFCFYVSELIYKDIRKRVKRYLKGKNK